jgi:hypothetical protein
VGESSKKVQRRCQKQKIRRPPPGVTAHRPARSPSPLDLTSKAPVTPLGTSAPSRRAPRLLARFPAVVRGAALGTHTFQNPERLCDYPPAMGARECDDEFARSLGDMRGVVFASPPAPARRVGRFGRRVGAAEPDAAQGGFAAQHQFNARGFQESDSEPGPGDSSEEDDDEDEWDDFFDGDGMCVCCFDEGATATYCCSRSVTRRSMCQALGTLFPLPTLTTDPTVPFVALLSRRLCVQARETVDRGWLPRVAARA